MTITTLPTPPQRTDTQEVFDSRADALMGALPTFVTEANALAVEVNTNAGSAAGSATVALNAAGASPWVSGTTYAQYAVAISPLNFHAYRRKVAGAGTTDPSLDATNWQPAESTDWQDVTSKPTNLVTLLASLTPAGQTLVACEDAAAQRTAIGLGNVDNTSDASKPVSIAQAAADAASTAVNTHGASTKTPLVDADEIPVADSESSWGLKKITWANIKAMFGSAAFKATGTSGNAVPLLDGVNTWSAQQIMPSCQLLAESAPNYAWCNATIDSSGIVTFDTNSSGGGGGAGHVFKIAGTQIFKTTANGISINKNMDFGGTGRRITADLSTATIADRAMLQSSVANSATSVGAIPNGTSATAGWRAYNSSTPGSASYGEVSVNGTETRIEAGKTGSGSYLPVVVYTSGFARATYDLSGNYIVGGTSLMEGHGRTTLSLQHSFGGLIEIGKAGGGWAIIYWDDASNTLNVNGRTTNANVSLSANGTGIVEVASKTRHNTYTQLGSDAPGIKTKKLTGTTAASQGGQALVAHGLTGNKILNVFLRVEWSPGAFVAGDHPIEDGVGASVLWDAVNITVRNTASGSSGILSKSFTVFVVYEE